MPLWPGLPVTLTLAGQARWRGESVKNFNLSALQDDHSQSRLQLSADVQVGNRTDVHARVFVEGRDAQGYGRTLPGGIRPSDADRHDIQNLFADVAIGQSYVRVGRQEIMLNRERFLGVPDWANTRRGAQGVRAHAVVGTLVLEAIEARPVIVRQTAPNRADSSTRFRTFSIGSADAAPPRFRSAPTMWQLYRYAEQKRSWFSEDNFYTTGGRALWQHNTSTMARQYSLELEGAVQRPTKASFWIAEVLVKWNRVPGSPSLAIGREVASGDNPSTAVNETFRNPFSAAHAHGGYADVIGRPNAREWHMIGTWIPLRTLDVRAAFYRFDRIRLDGSVYAKNNAVFRAASGSTLRHVANEWDLTGNWMINRHLRVIAGGAVVTPGAFLKNTPGSARTERWGFAGTALTF